MEANRKHWIDPGFLASNVVELDLPAAPLRELTSLVPEIRRIPSEAKMIGLGNGIELHVERRPDWSSDIAWLSQANLASYRFFERVFGDLGLAERMARHIEHDRSLILYSGFFVTRSVCRQEHFHFDWVDSNNDAFTLLAPLSDNCADIGLSYRDVRGETRNHMYRTGKGVILGDHFYHSTGIGTSSEQTVLLSMTFGTDRMENWPKISRTAARQGIFHRRPDGTFILNGKPLATENV